MTFIELPLFTELITGLVDDACYANFQKDLLRQPNKGDVMRHSGGLRKVRLRLPGRGNPTSRIRSRSIVTILRNTLEPNRI